ncbi:MAG: ATP-binding protein [Pseudomonadota bacterium]
MRVLVVVSIIAGTSLVIVSNEVLTRRFSERLHAESRLTAALYAGNMVGILERQSIVPLLLARDPVFISDLRSNDYQDTSTRLMEFKDEINAAEIDLLDGEGRVVASSERRDIGMDLSEKPYFINARRDPGTVFTVSDLDEGSGRLTFQYSRKIEDGEDTLGIVVVHLELARLEESWRQRASIVAVTDGEDRVVLASNPLWRRRTLSGIIAEAPQPSLWQRVLEPPGGGEEAMRTAFLANEQLLRNEVPTTFRGWRLTYFSTLDDVRTRVAGILAVEIMALALMMAGGLWLVNKRLSRQQRRMIEEGHQLRRLNTRLSEEIEERRRVEQSLTAAEQSLEQASKLAALGQMSAAVSHELNQPLAAMRTYLAGARLLLRRGRSEEALASFHRIDDLIERMGTITRQLKSFARKGTTDDRIVDMRDAVDGSITMMAPQLKGSRIEVVKILPPEPVPVRADPVRLDQVIVNLLRNAVDAVEDTPDPKIELLLTAGRHVTLTVRDNGIGIGDTEALFEPFYTTKKPGEGVGLGLAISAGIASELGGQLTARNAQPRGAAFELQLPRAEETVFKAAE